MPDNTVNNFLKYTSHLKNPLILILFAMLITGCYLWIDQPVAVFFHSMNPEKHYSWLLWITNAGKAAFYVFLLLSLMIFFRFIWPDIKREMQCRFLILCILIPNMICLVLKVVLGRARPELWITQHQYGFFGIKLDKLYWSFPSSHATTVMGLIIGMCLLFPRYRLFFLLSGFMIMVSRIVLFQHFVSDILAAIILTLMETGILVYFLQERAWFVKSLPK